MNLQLFSSAFVLNAAWCPYHASLQNYQCTIWAHHCDQSWAVIHLLPPSIALHPACQKTPTCGFFFFIFKKIKISKIYIGFGKFQKYTPVALWGGDRAQM